MAEQSPSVGNGPRPVSPGQGSTPSANSAYLEATLRAIRARHEGNTDNAGSGVAPTIAPSVPTSPGATGATSARSSTSLSVSGASPLRTMSPADTALVLANGTGHVLESFRACTHSADRFDDSVFEADHGLDLGIVPRRALLPPIRPPRRRYSRVSIVPV